MVDHIDVEEVAVRSGTTAAWAAAGAPTLGNGELGIDLDTHEIRIGDGTSVFADLPVTAGGGGAVVRKRIAYDFDYTIDPDPGSFNAGTTITTTPLAEGTIIEDAWVSLRGQAASIQFAAGQPYMGIYVNLVPVATPGDFDDFLYYDITSQTAGQITRAAIREVGTADVNRTIPCIVSTDDCHLAIHLESDTPFTAGTATLFVLYSEPA
jgi:hypothetical protein